MRFDCTNSASRAWGASFFPRDLSLRRGVLKLWVCGMFILFFFATTDSCGDPATSLSKRPLRDQNKNSFIEDFCEDT